MSNYLVLSTEFCAIAFSLLTGADQLLRDTDSVELHRSELPAARISCIGLN